jgi:guanosine-3',5'-bis(diphosphate) 3'-pyrophosphohydrolase
MSSVEKMVKLSDVKLLIKMMHFAAEKHRNQRRYDEEKTPYINHPIEVAYLLAEYTDIANMSVYMAALAHDTIEDQNVTKKELSTAFNNKTAKIVTEVSDDMSMSKNEIKKEQLLTAKDKTVNAALLKVADKISSMRDMMENPPPEWPRSTKLKSFKHSKKLFDNLPKLPKHSLPLQKLFLETYREGIIMFSKKKIAVDATISM